MATTTTSWTNTCCNIIIDIRYTHLLLLGAGVVPGGTYRLMSFRFRRLGRRDERRDDGRQSAGDRIDGVYEIGSKSKSERLVFVGGWRTMLDDVMDGWCNCIDLCWKSGGLQWKLEVVRVGSA